MIHLFAAPKPGERDSPLFPLVTEYLVAHFRSMQNGTWKCPSATTLHHYHWMRLLLQRMIRCVNRRLPVLIVATFASRSIKRTRIIRLRLRGPCFTRCVFLLPRDFTGMLLESCSLHSSSWFRCLVPFNASFVRGCRVHPSARSLDGGLLLVKQLLREKLAQSNLTSSALTNLRQANAALQRDGLWLLEMVRKFIDIWFTRKRKILRLRNHHDYRQTKLSIWNQFEFWWIPQNLVY